MIDARLGGAGVAAPEEIVVVQFVIKVVKGFANSEAGVEGENLFIAFIENAFKYGTDFQGNTDIEINLEIKEQSISLIKQEKKLIY